MSAGDIKAEAIIELETSSLETASKKVQKQFKNIGESATKSGQKSDKAMGKTGTAATKAANKIKETGTAGTAAGDKVTQGANKGARALDKMGTSADGAAGGMQELSTSMIGIAQGATGISDAVFGLSASFVGLEKTGFGIKGMEIAVRRMEEDLVVAFQTGTLTIRDQERSVEDLELAYEALALEEKQVDADTLALNGQIVTLTINIAATSVQTVIAISVMKTMRIVTAQNALATSVDSTAKAVNTGVTATMTGAILASAAAVRAFTISMLTSPLAPYAIAAIGVGTAFIALNDNIGGVRDSVEDLTGQERGSFPTLGVSMTGLGDDMTTAEESMKAYGAETEEFAEIIGTTTDSITAFIESLDPGSTDALGSFGDSLGNATDKLIPFANGIFDAAGNMVNLNDRTSQSNKVMDDWTRAMFKANDELRKQNSLLDENTKKKQQTSSNPDGFGLNGTFPRTNTPTRRGNVEQDFFNSLPPEVKGGFKPITSVGTPQHIRERIARRDGFANSVRSVIQRSLGIITFGGTGNSATSEFKRFNKTRRLSDALAIIKKARSKGIISTEQLRITFPGFEAGTSKKTYVNRALSLGSQLKPIIEQFDRNLAATQLAEEKAIQAQQLTIRTDNFSPLANILNISSTDFQASEFASSVASELNISEGSALRILQQGGNGTDIANQIRFTRRTKKEIQHSTFV